ncbi:MAG: NAD(P)H-dependent oxidoreductase subunit E [Candidatus Omnitrophica bacterium]|nr:NAD(P)H-dependent oxidoreductase subunit E [Candidatus Omnitrophota bacterium]
MTCAVKTQDHRMAELKTFMEQLRGTPRSESNLIAILHKVQELYGYLNREAMDEVAATMQIPTAHIWGVATFYHYFKLKAPGKHVIAICLGTACYIKGAGEILEKLKDELKIDIGGISPDGMFSLEEARCLGACGLAPVMMIDGKIYGSLTPKRVSEIIQGYRKLEAASVKSA